MANLRFSRVILFLIGAALLPAAPAAAAPGEWTALFRRPADEVGARAFCKPLLLPDDRVLFFGPPGKDPTADWCAAALDLAGGAWRPLPPRGKEAWLQTRPKVTYAMRWGTGGRLEEVEGLLQPAPAAYFNQAVYVPPLRKALYFIGGRTLAFDPAAGTWEDLKPRNSPPLVLWGAMEYDPLNEEVLLFGGGALCPENRPGTWLYSPKANDWRRLEQPLAEQPPARCNAPLAYDSRNRLIALFGGDAQDRYLSDTWVYDCARRRWRELKTNVRPYPRGQPALCYLERHGVFLMGGAVPPAPADARSWPKSPGPFAAETWTLHAATGTWTRVAGSFPAAPWVSALYDARRDRVLLHRAQGQRPKETEVHAWQPSLAPAGPGQAAPERPVYKYLPPEAYEAGLPPADEGAGEKLLQGMKPNEWTAVETPRPAFTRTWGAATIDTDRHEVLYWGGGHCGYCGTDVSHFSLKTLRWSTGFPPEFPPAPYNGFYGEESSFLLACRSFRGRPWVQHGRTSYAYDPVTRLAAFTQSISEVPTRAWTYVYDPAKRDFVDVFEQPFIGGWSVSGAVTATRRGLYNYLTPGDHRSPSVGLFHLDLKARRWVNLSGGRATAPCRESERMLYDSKRDRLLLLSRAGSARDAAPAMYTWDLAGATADWVRLEMAGEPPASFHREGAFIERHDCVLHLARDAVYVCDLGAGNRWRKLAVGLPAGVRTDPGIALAYDPELDVLVLLYGGTLGPVRTWVMRYAPGG